MLEIPRFEMAPRAAMDHVGIGMGARGGADRVTAGSVFGRGGVPATRFVKVARRMAGAVMSRREYRDDFRVHFGVEMAGLVTHRVAPCWILLGCLPAVHGPSIHAGLFQRIRKNT